MNNRPISEAKAPELRYSMQGLRRARKRAEEIAIATGTAIIQMQDGKIVRYYPKREEKRDP